MLIVNEFFTGGAPEKYMSLMASQGHLTIHQKSQDSVGSMTAP